MPVTPLSSLPSLFSLLSLSSDFSHPFATGGGSFSAWLLCTFSLFFCLWSLQGICPTLFFFSISASLLPVLLSVTIAPLLKPPSIYSLHCVEKSKIFEGSLVLLTSFTASTRECPSSVFFCHLLSSLSGQWSKPVPRYQRYDGEMKKKQKWKSPDGHMVTLASIFSKKCVNSVVFVFY